jgi:hypothetical protein
MMIVKLDPAKKAEMEADIARLAERAKDLLRPVTKILWDALQPRIPMQQTLLPLVQLYQQQNEVVQQVLLAMAQSNAQVAAAVSALAAPAQAGRFPRRAWAYH